ncbi:MAG: hypothetical protein HY430_03530 [Candidatus Levybacteria bacterium]|nr:hypothetical protein [Candidatus Levybacteria bacterium]
MVTNTVETGTDISETKLSRRALLGLGVAAGVKAVLGSRPALAAPEDAAPPQTGLPAQEAEVTQVPLPTPEQQREEYGYEIEWENGPFGNVTLCIEKNLFEAETNWMHKIELNTDPETGFPDAQDRLNDAIRLGMYRAWQSNKPETRNDVSLEEFTDKLEAGKNMRFKAKGRKGTDPFQSEITIDPADPLRLVWLGTPGHAMYDKYGGRSEGFTSNNNETRLEFWSEHYFVPENGDYGGEQEQYQMHRTQALGSLALDLVIMSVPELQNVHSITAEQEQKYLIADDSRLAEIKKYLFTRDPESKVLTNYIFTVS